jgi:uncharacterized protein YjlB
MHLTPSTMVEIQRYYLSPNPLIPNSPQPLLYYKNLFTKTELQPSRLHELFDQNGWKSQWIFRYGPTQEAHYHSGIHECMVVLSGTATIRFGAADTCDDLTKSRGRYR